MIDFELRRDEGILIVMPRGPLETADFERLRREVDPYIAEKGRLAGLLIHARVFPGWRDFAGFRAHVRFVKAHHHAIGRIAAASDSCLASIAPCIARFFVQPEVKRFRYQDKEAALAWIRRVDR